MESQLNEPMNNDEEDPLSLLLQSCASITHTALSCKTLGIDISSMEGKSNIDALYQKELEKAKWLESQIQDYRAAIFRSQSDTGNDANRKGARKRYREEDNEENPKQQIVSLQENLLDESERIQRCRMLQSRIRMATLAQQTLFPQNNSADPNATFLHKEALRSRDEQVTLALENLRRLDDLKSQTQSASEECRTLLQRNRDLWRQLDSSNPSATDTQHLTPISASHNTQNQLLDPNKKLEMENLILKRVLLDLIVGSGIDWYSDKRIWKTMVKLES